MTSKYLICEDSKQYFEYATLLQKACNKNKLYTSKCYCGAEGTPDIINKDGKPLIPYLEAFSKEIDAFGLPFEEVDISTIKNK